MSQYEKILDLIADPTTLGGRQEILTGRAQIQYINELEELCDTCDRVIIHSEIARTAFSHRKYMERFAARRGFKITFVIKRNSFVLTRIGENRANVPIEKIIFDHKEDACQKTLNNRKAMTKLRRRK